MKVSTKLYLGTVLQFLVALSLVAVFLYMLQKQEHDSIVINLAEPENDQRNISVFPRSFSS